MSADRDPDSLCATVDGFSLHAQVQVAPGSIAPILDAASHSSMVPAARDRPARDDLHHQPRELEVEATNDTVLDGEEHTQ